LHLPITGGQWALAGNRKEVVDKARMAVEMTPKVEFVSMADI
jgi:hypothetical protein